MTLIFVDIPPKISMKNSPLIDLQWGRIYRSPRKWQNLLNFLQGEIVQGNPQSATACSCPQNDWLHKLFSCVSFENNFSEFHKKIKMYGKT